MKIRFGINTTGHGKIRRMNVNTSVIQFSRSYVQDLHDHDYVVEATVLQIFLLVFGLVGFNKKLFLPLWNLIILREKNFSII